MKRNLKSPFSIKNSQILYNEFTYLKTKIISIEWQNVEDIRLIILKTAAQFLKYNNLYKEFPKDQFKSLHMQIKTIIIILLFVQNIFFILKNDTKMLKKTDFQNLQKISIRNLKRKYDRKEEEEFGLISIEVLFDFFKLNEEKLVERAVQISLDEIIELFFEGLIIKHYKKLSITLL